MFRRALVLSCVASLTICLLLATPVAAQAPRIVNLGLAADIELQPDGRFVAFKVKEASQGGTDLNGDGDASDSVLFVTKAGSPSAVNLGVVPNDFRLAGDLLAYSSVESQAGADLNGDSDTLDNVLQLRDLASATTTNVGLAVSDGKIAVDGRIVAFAVGEAAQGGADLNRDADASDTVVHFYDTRTGRTNLGLAIGPQHSVQLKDGILGFRVSEADQANTDLNLDSDTSDFVIHVHRTASGTTTNLRQAVVSQENVSGDFVAFQVQESGQGGTDLNGDGDTADRVMHSYEVASGSLSNLRLAAAYSFQELNSKLLAFQVNEISQGLVDLNGDGDTVDTVMFLHEGGSPSATNLGLATCIPQFSLAGGVVSVGVAESGQGASDLNGDGDTGDCVLHVHRVGGPTVNVGQAISLQPAGNGQTVAFKVFEAQQGNTDLNGDGDTADRVAHTYDVVAGTTTNLGLATATLQLSERLFAFPVFESLQGGTDLNGDGDTSDIVTHVLDLSTGITYNLGHAVSAYTKVSGNVVAFHVLESADGNVDLNGDGDTSDSVLYVAVFP